MQLGSVPWTSVTRMRRDIYCDLIIIFLHAYIHVVCMPSVNHIQIFFRQVRPKQNNNKKRLIVALVLSDGSGGTFTVMGSLYHIEIDSPTSVLRQV